MQVRHPLADTDIPTDDYVTLGGETVPVDADGIIETDASESAVRAWLAGYDADLEHYRVKATCQVEKADGEICGRELPCPYHSEGTE